MKSARPNIRTWLAWTIAVVLLLAAISKFADLDEFRLNLSQYQLSLPESLLQILAVGLPAVELICALLLFPTKTRRIGLIIAIGLFGLFTIVTGQAWARGLNISCGCVNLPFLSEKYAGIFESAPFAFFRALALTLATVGLLLAARQPAREINL